MKKIMLVLTAVCTFAVIGCNKNEGGAKGTSSK